MKVHFNKEALAEALSILTPVIPSRTPRPILRSVRITAEEKDVKICATDLEVAVDCIVSGVKIEEPGQVVIPADRLAAIVHESIDDVLSLQAAEDTCEVTGSDSRFVIYTQEPQEYPSIPEFDGPADIEVGLTNIQEGIERCLFATAKESTRYALNGVLWEIKGKKLSLVATDGRRLALTKVKLSSVRDEAVTEKTIIVPAKTMALLDKIGDDTDAISIKLLDNKIMMSGAKVVISSNLVEGSFPKYEDIIPKDYDKKLVLSTESALSAVRRAALLTSVESRGIKLAAEKDMLTFSGRSPETGDAQVKMKIDYKGEPIDIGFNPQFLIDVLRAIKKDTFELELGQSDRPGLIKSGKDFLCVLMPINIG